MKSINKILIGIDPDVEKNGFAKIEGNQLKIDNLTFFELFEELKFYKEREIKPIVYVECGFLNKSNWHSKKSFSSAMNSKIGERTGANFETAKKIVEMCIYLRLPYFQIKPTRKKSDSDLFKQATGLNIRTNQEQRDAYFLIHGR